MAGQKEPVEASQVSISGVVVDSVKQILIINYSTVFEKMK